jgi:hypothetical protein
MRRPRSCARRCGASASSPARRCAASGALVVHVEQAADAAVELDAGFGQPDGVQVALDQFAVGQVEGRRIDLAMDHAHRVAEEILVVRRLGGAVGNDQRRLPGPPGPAAALRVVGRRRRHVAQVDGVQRRDVDAEFHGRRAEHYRQPFERFAGLLEPFVAILAGEAEARLAFEAVVLLDLGRMLARLEVEQAVGGVGEQPAMLP